MKRALEKGQRITFLENFSETIGKVTFNMDIVVSGGLTEGSVVTAKVQMQKKSCHEEIQFLSGG